MEKEKQLIFLENSKGVVKSKNKTGNLFVLSDDEIKEGDWYYWSVTNTIQKAIKDSLGRLPKIQDGSKKIIATTDKELPIDITNITQYDFTIQYLPQLSLEFINKYVTEYNKGNIITKVLVEYNDIINDRQFEYLVILNNTINIQPIEKNNYSKVEVANLISKAMSDFSNQYKEQLELGLIDFWINENL